MEELNQVCVLAERGFEGCAHARPKGNRQVLLIDKETLDAFNLPPGIVRENITTHGLDVNALAVGQKLRVGQTQLQVTMPCEPCDQIEQLRAGLRQRMQGKRGVLCRVLHGGIIHRGDVIEKVSRD
jgi:MOSC domain-containing protein YiiM